MCGGSIKGVGEAKTGEKVFVLCTQRFDRLGVLDQSKNEKKLTQGERKPTAMIPQLRRGE